MDFIRRRLKVLVEYVMHRNRYSSYVKPNEVLKILFEPPLKKRAYRYIENITPDQTGRYLVVKIKGVSRSLYWPKQFALKDLYQVISEIFNIDDWHCYDIDQTSVNYKDVVVDCGASEGAFALKNYEKAKFIYLIEPLGTFIDSLKRTFAKASKVEVINCAITDGRSNEVFINNNSIFSSSSRNAAEKVRACSVDNLFFEKGVNYIKADVEGAEFDLLKGAVKTIARYRPKIAIAVYHDNNDWQAMLNFVRGICPQYQYKLKGIYHVNLKPVLLHLWV